MYQSDLTVLGATRAAVGLSSVIRFVPDSYRYATTIKYLSGGTLEIIKAATTNASGAGSSLWGAGYPLDSTEIMSFNGPTAFYLVATGATAIFAMVMGYTAGATLV